MIQRMNRKERIEIICLILSRWKPKRKCKKQTWTGINREWWIETHRNFPVLLRTTKLPQSTSQYYFVLQSLHKVLPSATSYYKACTQYFPVLLRTTKLAQSTSQYYFVLQNLHKVRPSTTSYYKASTKYFPVLLRTLWSLLLVSFVVTSSNLANLCLLMSYLCTIEFLYPK